MCPKINMCVPENVRNTNFWFAPLQGKIIQVSFRLQLMLADLNVSIRGLYGK